MTLFIEHVMLITSNSIPDTTIVNSVSLFSKSAVSTFRPDPPNLVAVVLDEQLLRRVSAAGAASVLAEGGLQHTGRQQFHVKN